MEYKRRAKIYQIRAEQVTRNTMQYLNVEISINLPMGTFDVTPFRKPTAFGIPRCPTSGHSLHVHRSWPQACIRRMEPVANTVNGRRLASSIMWELFNSNMVSTELLIPHPRQPLLGTCLRHRAYGYHLDFTQDGLGGSNAC